MITNKGNLEYSEVLEKYQYVAQQDNKIKPYVTCFPTSVDFALRSLLTDYDDEFTDEARNIIDKERDKYGNNEVFTNADYLYMICNSDALYQQLTEAWEKNYKKGSLNEIADVEMKAVNTYTNLKAEIKWANLLTETQDAIKNGSVVVISTLLSPYGHMIAAFGLSDDQSHLLCNDPFGINVNGIYATPYSNSHQFAWYANNNPLVFTKNSFIVVLSRK